jgi:hypothetical protein
MWSLLSCIKCFAIQTIQTKVIEWEEGGEKQPRDHAARVGFEQFQSIYHLHLNSSYPDIQTW